MWQDQKRQHASDLKTAARKGRRFESSSLRPQVKPEMMGVRDSLPVTHERTYFDHKPATTPILRQITAFALPSLACIFVTLTLSEESIYNVSSG